MFRLINGLFLVLLFVAPSWASDHGDYVSGSYTDARSVTEDCLSCLDCHHPDGVMDFKALGYKEDPALSGGRFKKVSPATAK